MKLVRFALIAIAVVTLVACKVRIVVPEGGQVALQSGSYCPSGKTCEIDVVDIFFDETFTAVPSTGYKFQSWAKRDRSLCGGNARPCHLFTSGFAGNDFLMAFLGTEDIFYLQPVFEKLAASVLSINNIQGGWIGSLELSSTALPGKCTWSVNSRVSGTIVYTTTTLVADTSPYVQCVTARSEGRVSIANNGSALVVDTYYHSATLIGPKIVQYEMAANGELFVESNFVSWGVPTRIKSTLRRP
jgi:hypothetical protein